MNTIQSIIRERPTYHHLQALCEADPQHPHIHHVDLPYRLTSTWQDQGCELAIWEKDAELLAWAVFQPPWWNLDYAVHPAERGAALEQEVLAWGKAQMQSYAARRRVAFYGSVEFFADTPGADRTQAHLAALGFEPFDWSILRFSKTLTPELAPAPLPPGYVLRPLRGQAEVEPYVTLHRVAFGSERMTVAWRQRMLEHPGYRPEIDLVVESAEGNLAGFCVCWLWQGVGQIEPLGVHPDHQGQGLGRALELAAFQALYNAGARAILVDHVSENADAIALSLKTGFRQVNQAVRYFIRLDSTNI